MTTPRSPSFRATKGPSPLVLALAAATCALLPGGAASTPTTLFWAPSTAAVQRFAVLHLTYDTYFWPGSSRSAAHPVVLGVTVGVLPFERLQLEAGFDGVLPTSDPLLLNAKLGSPEDALFAGSPAWAVGIFDAGVTDATALNIAYAVLGKRTPLGAVSAGGYVGSARLLRSSSGAVHRAGLLGGIALRPLAVNRPWLDHVEVRWDVLTGKNVAGATGGGIGLFFTPWLAMLTGPVFYFDPSLQPGGAGFAWSVQLDVDLDLRAKRAPAREPLTAARSRRPPGRPSR